MEQSEKDRTLLLVDDEENILSSLTRLFRRQGYKILRANSGQQGIEILKDNPVGVIVSDQRMPEMTGVEFLSKVKLSHPDTIRIILSGYTDLKSITESINEGAIYKFLTKPWDDNLLLKHVADAFETYEMKKENERLSKELKTAYSSLEKVSDEINEHFVKKTIEAEFNVNILRIAQEVLENMPAGIIGVGDDGMIAITNNLTEKWLSKESESLIGSMAEQSLPPAMLDLYRQYLENNNSDSASLTLPNSLQLEVRCSKLGKSSNASGTVLVLTKTI